MLACSRAAGLHVEAIHNQAGLDCVRPRGDPAGDLKNDLSTAGSGQNKARETGFCTKSERRKSAKLRKSRSGTETLQTVSAEQTQRLETTIETLSVLSRTDTGLQYRMMALESPPMLASELTSLPAMSWKPFARDLHDGRIEQICILSDVERKKSEAEEPKQLVTKGADALSAKSKKERFDEQSWDSLKSSPLYEVLREYKDVIPDDIPAELPQNKGVQHEIDLVSGTKYCVTRQWPLPREQVKAIDAFFESRRTKECPSDVQQVRHALVALVRDFAPSYFDDVFVHSRAVNGKSDVEMHKEHLRKLFALMPKHKCYANLKKCIFGASEIPVLGYLVGKNGVTEKNVRVINEWPTPSNAKELRQFLGLATYLCKYVSNYASKIRQLSQLLKIDSAWDWTAECQQAFDAVKQAPGTVKQGLTEAPILAVADQDRPFHVVCDASDFAIGSALMQHDHEGRDRVVYYQSRQLKPAERNYSYKPGRLNVVADALSRRPDYAVHKTDANAIGVVRTITPSSSLLDDVRSTYANNADAKQLLNYFAVRSDKSRQKLAKHLRARVHRYRVHNGLPLYSAVDDNADRVCVPEVHELKLRITYEYHDAPTSGHPGREKTYLLLTRVFYWRHLGTKARTRLRGMPAR
ncbi:unnamed protein product [Phytophthora fragariaefolia]|uniref:Unnamed protein product n=1 Tax=Phytophthora fragariaefolia TaxID=1490495 RepID=A0A9W6YAH1_9STRA|nr:unnamed protein product [Phytophthora fragariaefolia]